MMPYIYIINSINVALTNKKQCIFLKNCNKNKILLKTCVQCGLILGYTTITENKIQIFLNTTSNKFKIRTVSTITNKKTIKINEIKKLSNLKTSSNYILSTSCGIMTLHDAVLKNVGGIILFKIS